MTSSNHHTKLTVDPDYVPGSEYIFASSYENSDTLLKDKDIVLIPQPTTSPNDPLNWPKWRRFVQLGIILFIRGVSTAVADDSFSIIQGLQAEYPNYNTGSFTSASGVLFVGLGCWALLNAPSAYLYGCRISYIVGRVFGIIGNALFSQVNSESMLYASQFFVGAATSVGESVTILSFAQLCFQHQINDVIGLFVLATSAGTFAGPLIDGYVAQNLGWHWVGYLGLIFEVAMLLLVLFGMEETYFDRAHFETKSNITVIEGVTYSGNTSEESSQKAKESDSANKKQGVVEVTPEPPAPELQARASLEPRFTTGHEFEGGLDLHEPKQAVPDAPKTYFQRIKIITPANNIKGLGLVQYAKRAVLLCRVFLFPPVIFSGLQWATQIGFITVYKSVENDAWIGPPWNYSSGPLALMMIPNLIGAAIGSLYSTWGADWFIRYMARRNDGLHEAESRLWLMIPVAVVYPLGLLLFGVGTHYHWSWPPVYVGLGLVGFAFGSAGEISISYMTDCYPGMVLEGMVGLVFIYTMSSLIISFLASDWLTVGNLNAMIICAVLGFFMVSLSLPMAIWGKKMRRMTRSMYFNFVSMRDSLNQE